MKLLHRNKKSSEECSEKKQGKGGMSIKSLFGRKKNQKQFENHVCSACGAFTQCGNISHNQGHCKANQNNNTMVPVLATTLSEEMNGVQHAVKAIGSNARVVENASRDDHHAADAGNVSEGKTPDEQSESVDQNEREEPEAARSEEELADSPKEEGNDIESLQDSAIVDVKEILEEKAGEKAEKGEEEGEEEGGEGAEEGAEEKAEESTEEKIVEKADEGTAEEKVEGAAEGAVEDEPDAVHTDEEEIEKHSSPEENDSADRAMEETRDFPDDTAEQTLMATPIAGQLGLMCGWF